MQTKKFTLKNGLKVVLVNLPGSLSCSINLYLPAGYKYDPKDKPGLAHLSEHMMLTGTKKYPTSKDLDSATAIFGGLQTAFTWIDYQLHSVKVPSNKFKEGLKVLSETVFSPLLKEEELEKEKQSVTEEIYKDEAEPGMAVWDYAWNQAFWKGNRLAKPYTGNIQDLDQISVKDIVEFVNTIALDKAILCLSGGIDFCEAANIIEKYFGTNKTNHNNIKPPKVVPNVGGSIKIIPSEVENDYLMFGFKTVGKGHMDTHILHMVSRLLGGSFSGILVDKLREKGLIYDWLLDQDSLQDTGYIYFKTSTGRKKLVDTIKIICEAFKRIADGKISKKEIEVVRSQTIGEFLLNMETATDYCKWFGEQEFLTKGHIEPKEMVEIYKNITPKSLRETAMKYFTIKNWYLGIVGEAEEKRITETIEASLS